ncbi:efflux RND transporter permease subunit [Candidatus Peregrinibacteria bacterium]|nr:MAG: efflux RND transporter permease subunit [Candidatus Peregrinibacteria bacterium]
MISPEKSSEGVLEKIGGFFVRRLKVSLLVGVILCAWGILSVIAISKESAPYIEFGVVVISTSYSGASAIDVDELVTQEIEDRVKNVSGLNKFSSVSRNSISTITLEFEPGQNMTKAIGDIRSKVDEAKPSLPAEIDDDPVITEIDSSLEPFLTVVLSGDVSFTELTDNAESLKGILEDVPNVAQVDIQGGKEREIGVEVDRDKLKALGLSISDVINVIRSSHRDTPAGDIEGDDFSYSIRFSGKHRTKEDVENLIIRDFKNNGTSSFVRVRDVAEVFEREKDTKSVSRFVTLSEEKSADCLSRGRFSCLLENVRSGVINGNVKEITGCIIVIFLFFLLLFPPSLAGNPLPRYLPGIALFFLLLFWFSSSGSLLQYESTKESFQNSVELSLSRKSGSDILKADTTSKDAVQHFQEEQLPENISVTFTNDAAKVMRDDYKSVIQSGLQSLVIVMLFIFFFVGIREGLVASLVIPITFLITIGILFFTGRTLNFMTNFSMILALGILVDTAIVIVEGTHHYIQSGLSPRRAALLSLQEFSGPLLSGTLTTVAVFIPLLSLSGILGQYLSFIPVTVIIVLSVSLLVSLFLLPSYASFLMKKSSGSIKPRFFRNTRLFGAALRKRIDRRVQNFIRWYQSILRFLIQDRFRRLGLFGLAFFCFFASFHIPIPFVLFPSGDAPSLTIAIELPEGISEKRTLEASLPVEDEILTFPEVKFIRTAISGKTANIYVEFLPEEDRKRLKMRTSKELENIFSERTAPIVEQFGASVRVQSAANGPPSDFPVGFRVIAHDRNAIEDAKKFAEELTELLITIPGTTGVRNDIEEIPGEFQFQVRRDRALALGIDPESIPIVVRSAIQGTTAATITRNTRDIDIVVEYPEKDFTSLDDIESLSVRTDKGESVPLREVVTVERNNALAAIRRSEGDIAFTLSSLLAPEGNAAEVTDAFLAKKEEMGISTPEGIDVTVVGENEENAGLIADLSRGLVIAILIMFLILVVQFNAFLQPILVLFTILFAQIGVSIGLALTGTPRSLAYILGVIALAGIVVNDSIIMIDRMNENRRARQKNPLDEEEEFIETPEQIKEDIVETGGSRFIPVILTTLTTSAGIIPLIFQDQFWAGLSYTVIFGLLVASFLTLIITPSIYYQIQREPGATLLFIPVAICASLGMLSLPSPSFQVTLSYALIGGVFWFLFRWVCLRNDKKREGEQISPSAI